jgi:lysophospholipase L1-like esterase
MSHSKPQILFLGDSLTEYADWAALLHNNTIINHGVAGDRSSDVVSRISESIQKKPDLIFLMIGVNDLAMKMQVNSVLENITEIVKKLKIALPETTIYLQSILPVNPHIANFADGFDYNDKILEVNEQLNLNRNQLEYQYIDLHSKFRDKHGCLAEQYTTDGLHLNSKGYRHWTKFLEFAGFLNC